MDRLLSLDVMRGATIASMVMVNNPGTWAHVYPMLRHAEWHGWTFTDLIFPNFLWMAGFAMLLSFARRRAAGDDRHTLLLHTLRRGFLIFLIGFLLNLVPRFDWEHVRIPGVLQRIGIAYVFGAALCLYLRPRLQLLAAVVLMGVYWLLMAFGPIPGFESGRLDRDMNFARYIDSMFLQGHMWSVSKDWDPEGIISTLPSIATLLLGAFAGHIWQSGGTPAERATSLFFYANLCLFAGLCINPWLPINKPLWTSSFALFMAGISTHLFTMTMWLVDVQGWRRFTRPFEIYGTNSILSFVLSGALAKMLAMTKLSDGTSLHRWLYESFYASWLPPINASLAFALTEVILLWLVMYALWRRRWFLRL
jgi:predicted acyltransferase